MRDNKGKWQNGVIISRTSSNVAGAEHVFQGSVNSAVAVRGDRVFIIISREGYMGHTGAYWYPRTVKLRSYHHSYSVGVERTD